MAKARFILSVLVGFVLLSMTCQAGEKIRIGVYNFAPLVFIKPNGEADGFFIDIVNHIAGKEDWEVEYVPGSWDEGLKRLGKGELDLLACIASSPERARTFDFTGEFLFLDWGLVYTRKGRTLDSILEMEGMKVSALKGSIYTKGFEDLLQQFGIHCTLLEKDEYAQVFEAVATGEADAGINAQVSGILLQGAYPVERTKIFFSPVKLRLAAKKHNRPQLIRTLDAHIAKLKADRQSIYHALYDKWMGGGHQRAVPRWLLLSLAIAGGSALFFLFFAGVLRKQVAAKTAALLDANAELGKKTAQLEFNERLLSKSQEIAHLGSWRLDGEQNVLTWSEEEYRIFGLSPHELDPSYDAFLNRIHPGDRSLVDASYAHAVANNRPYESVHRIVRPDGEIRVVCEKSEDVLDADGRVIHSYGFTQDITEQIFANQRYEMIIRGSIDGFFVVDSTGRFVDVNDAYGAMVGYRREELLRMSLADFEVDEFSPEIARHIQAVTSKGHDRFVTRFRRQDRSVIDVEISANFSAQLKGDIFVFIRDISARNQDEAMRKSLEARLVQAQKMEAIGTLAGGIAHDFNNLLAIILGYTDMAHDDAPPGSKLAADLGKVLEAGNRARDLVKQILSFSRQTQIERIPLQLQSLVKESLKILRSFLPTTIDIEDELDSECGVVLADPTQVHQILMNLCTNAFHAMEDSGGILRIELRRLGFAPDDRQAAALNIAPGDYVELRVSDTGSGIGPDVITRIFEPYFTTKEAGKGTGMGLAIIHGIMADYGGAITVDSELGHGTTFHLYLPVVEQEELPPVGELEDIPRGKGRVLFIDDEELLLKMGRDLLERLGYTVTVRQSSLEALATFQDDPEAFDVVITDQTMPGMTGADLARRLLQIRPALPIILCTGYSNLIDEASAHALGIKAFAYKPLTKSTLANILHKVLAA